MNFFFVFVTKEKKMDEDVFTLQFALFISIMTMTADMIMLLNHIVMFNWTSLLLDVPHLVMSYYIGTKLHRLLEGHDRFKNLSRELDDLTTH